MIQNRSDWGAIEWLQTLHRYRSSHATVAEFCQQEGISIVAFNYWRKKLGGIRQEIPLAESCHFERTILLLAHADARLAENMT
ncbi:IS66 family insertion sequence element accessory protein TnpA [Schlesneria paludicola]|uniref:IS66 family insertion sequence element accessory protein TnpA n=1 Tax=Schlesneria paludicola TaxID=360056 RepID=UPI00029A7A84|nr:hypothetical protein [Schlesneria paludicola]